MLDISFLPSQRTNIAAIQQVLNIFDPVWSIVARLGGPCEGTFWNLYIPEE